MPTETPNPESPRRSAKEIAEDLRRDYERLSAGSADDDVLLGAKLDQLIRIIEDARSDLKNLNLVLILVPSAIAIAWILAFWMVRR